MFFMCTHLKEKKLDLGFVCDFAKTGQVRVRQRHFSLHVILKRLTIALVQLKLNFKV